MTLSYIPKSTVLSIGRLFFAIGIVGIGGQHYFFRQFVPMVVPAWPAGIPGRLFWVSLVGTILIVCGGAILSGIKARSASMLLAALFLASFLFLHIPANVAQGVTSLGGWTIALKAFAFAGCSLVIAGTFSDQRASTSGQRMIFYAMLPVAIMMIAFGIDHFLYVPFIATLVPAWIPGHIFWTYFAGAALIGAGIGMILPWTSRLAATLLGAMLLSWVILLHIPRAIADPYGLIGNEWTSVFQALAFSGVAFILGETLSHQDE